GVTVSRSVTVALSDQILLSFSDTGIWPISNASRSFSLPAGFPHRSAVPEETLDTSMNEILLFGERPESLLMFQTFSIVETGVEYPLLSSSLYAPPKIFR